MINTIIIKAVRACNLRCPYCYYINEQTTRYGDIIDIRTLEKLYDHVSQYLAGREGFSFIWHGGEPLILGRNRFQKFIELQGKYFTQHQIRNQLQTNGVLINQAWVNFFRHNDIGVGISIDSPEAHDKNRITTRGAGTYSRVAEAIKLFGDNGMRVGTLSVVDGDFDGYKALGHLEALNVPLCDFLIPATNNALQNRGTEVPYKSYTNFTKIGAFLVRAFHRWTEQPKPKLTVRLFECVIRNAFGFDSGYLNAGSTNLADFLVLETDGTVCLDPDFWHIDRFALGKHYELASNVNDKGFNMKAVESRMHEFVRDYHLDTLPDECQSCKVRSLCRASHPASRFNSDGSFNHRSAYCEAMFALCEAVLDYIVERGHAEYLCDEDLKRHLNQETSNALA